eukprot:10779618-Ditylum_brightwellii.AAC.1
MGGMHGGGIASKVPMFFKFACDWTDALGAVIGVIVGFSLGTPLGSMVVPMPWSGQAVCGIGIACTLGAVCMCTIWRCSVCSVGCICGACAGVGTALCCGIFGGATVCLCAGSASSKMRASCLSAACCTSPMRRNGDGGAGFCNTLIKSSAVIVAACFPSNMGRSNWWWKNSTVFAMQSLLVAGM